MFANKLSLSMCSNDKVIDKRINDYTAQFCTFAYGFCLWATLSGQRMRTKDIVRTGPIRHFSFIDVFCFLKPLCVCEFLIHSFPVISSFEKVLKLWGLCDSLTGKWFRACTNNYKLCFAAFLIRIDFGRVLEINTTICRNSSNLQLIPHCKPYAEYIW